MLRRGIFEAQVAKTGFIYTCPLYLCAKIKDEVAIFFLKIISSYYYFLV